MAQNKSRLLARTQEGSELVSAQVFDYLVADLRHAWKDKFEMQVVVP